MLAVAFQVTGTLIGVVVLDGFAELLEGEAVGQELCRIRLHMKLLGIAADAVHLGHARHLQQLRAYHPVLQAAQRRSVIGLAIGLACGWLGFDGVEEDFAQARRNRPQCGFHIVRQPAARLLQPLVDEIAGEVEVSAFLENDCDVGQSVARQRAAVFQTRQAGDGRLDGHGDALLDFQRRVAGRLRIDLHLHVGDVGDGINRQALVVVDAECHEGEHQHHHDAATGDGEA